MGAFDPKFENYQDVKTTLGWWSAPIWILSVWVIWRAVLEQPHRDWVLSRLPDVDTWMQQVGVLSACVVIGLILGQFLVHVVQIHDHFYDRYIVKWRKSYVSDKIIPALLTPALNRLPSHAVETANQHWGKCMKHLFYHFVSDHDTKIGKNPLVRFYERVTKYWLAQLAQVAAILLGIFTLSYGLANNWPSLPPRHMYVVAGCLGVFAVAGYLSRGLRNFVWQATQEEIDAIHSHAEYETQLSTFCREVGLALDDKH